MIEAKYHIEMTIRAAVLAGDLLSLAKSPGKVHALIVMRSVAEQFKELAELINKLPKD